MTPTEHEGTLATEAVARAMHTYATLGGPVTWDDLSTIERHAWLSDALPLAWAALEALPDRLAPVRSIRDEWAALTSDREHYDLFRRLDAITRPPA